MKRIIISIILLLILNYSTFAYAVAHAKATPHKDIPSPPTNLQISND